MHFVVLSVLSLLGCIFLGCGSVSAGDMRDAAADAPVDQTTCVVSSPSVRARWRAEANANEDTGVYNATSVGAAGYTTGKHGMAFSFDGLDDAIIADSGDQLWPTGSFTIELWMKTTAPGPAALMQKYECGGLGVCAGSVWDLNISRDGYALFTIRVTGTDSATATASTKPIVDGMWHHLVGLRDVPAKQLVLYVDGTAELAAPLAEPFLGSMVTTDASPDPVTIGASRSNGSETLQFDFVGAIDEPAYYISALSAAEVAAIYAAPNGICR
jgi:Concanavalin A-like lectin/glucanases superfamily